MSQTSALRASNVITGTSSACQSSLPILPAPLAACYRVVADLHAHGPETELVLAESYTTPPHIVVIRIYRSGLPAKTEIRNWLARQLPNRITAVHESGRAEGVCYEVSTYVPEGSLRTLINHGPLAETEIWALLSELSVALRELHERHLLHGNLKPENVLIHSRDPLRLILTDLRTSLPDTTFSLPFASPRTLRYSAPEWASGLVGTAADYWSLGMLLLEALTGHHPFAGLSNAVIRYQLRVRPVPLDGVTEPWRSLCQGLLLRDPRQRWGARDIQSWLIGEPVPSPPLDLPQAEAVTLRPGRFYRLAGVECRTPRELAVQMADHWAEACMALTNGTLGDWLRDLGEREIGRAVLQILDAADPSPDERLAGLLAHLAPDLPPRWRHWRLTAHDLVAVAEAARQGDLASQTVLLELYQGTPDVLGIYAAAGHAECQWLKTAWQAAGTDYEHVWSLAQTYGLPRPYPDAALPLPDLLLIVASPFFQDRVYSEIHRLTRTGPPRPRWLDAFFTPLVSGGKALAVRDILHWWSVFTEIQHCAASRLEALLKDLAILHRCPDFLAALERFEHDLACGIYLSQEAVVQTLAAIYDAAYPLAAVLRHYQALSEHTAANSAAHTVLRAWQSRLVAPRYADTEPLRHLLTDPQRWRICIDGWERPPASPLRWEHEGQIWPKVPAGRMSIAFSPDGHWLASSGADRTIYLWRVDSQRRVADCRGHSGLISAMAFSPNGKLLASSGDRTVRIWRASNGQNLAVWRGHTAPVSAVAFSPDGRLLVSGSYDRTLRLWRVANGQCLAVWSGHIGAIHAVAFGPQGQFIASGGADRTVRLWRVETGECIAVLLGRTGRVTALAFSPDGRWLVSGSSSFSESRRDDDAIRLWRMENRQCVVTFLGHTGPVNAVAFSPDGRLIASGSSDRTVRLWRVENRQCTAMLPNPNGAVTAVAFSPDGQHLAGGGEHGLTLWHARQTAVVTMTLEELIAWEKAHADPYREIQWIPTAGDARSTSR